MSPKVNYFILADYTTKDEASGKLSVNGVFDTFRNVIYPAQSPKFYFVLGISKVNYSVKIVMEIFTPSGKQHSLAEFDVQTDMPNQIINISIENNSMSLPEKGTYLVKISDGEKDLDTYEFYCDYPKLERKFTEEEIENILKDPALIHGAKLKIECGNCKKEYLLDLHLDPKHEIATGFQPFPENNQIDCCNRILDITGIRREIEWSIGQQKPKADTK